MCAKSAIYAVMLLNGAVASAGIIITPGVDNSGTDNVVSNPCDSHITGPALMVQGCLNSNHSFFINFTGDELMQINGGQSSIEAVDGAFSYLNIALADPGWTYSKLLINIDATNTANGFVTFTGLPGGSSSPWALDPNGQNKFIITGEDFSSVSFITNVGVTAVDLVADVKQVRIGGIEQPPETPPDNPAPAPGTPGFLGLGLGLLGLRAMNNKRRSRTQA